MKIKMKIKNEWGQDIVDTFKPGGLYLYKFEHPANFPTVSDNFESMERIGQAEELTLIGHVGLSVDPGEILMFEQELELNKRSCKDQQSTLPGVRNAQFSAYRCRLFGQGAISGDAKVITDLNAELKATNQIRGGVFFTSKLKHLWISHVDMRTALEKKA